MADHPDDPDDTLEDVAYLARSGNRVRVLGALAATVTKPGQPTPGHEPRELRERTAVPKTTLSRIITEFEERGWAERNADGEYVATRRGELVASHFDPFVSSMEVLGELGEIAELLPTTELTIDLHHFSDATVRHPQGPQPDDFGRYLSDLIHDSTAMHLFSYVPVPGTLADERDETFASLDVFVSIWPDSLWDYWMNFQGERDTTRRALRTMGEYYSFEGHLPCNLFIFDEVVVIENSQVDGVKEGTAIESRNETVREWALDVFERYRAAAVEFTVEDIPE